MMCKLVLKYQDREYVLELPLADMLMVKTWLERMFNLELEAQ